MKDKNREICLWKTILASLWMYGLVTLFMIGSMIHSRNMLLVASTIPELIFWGTMMILFAMAFVRLLPAATFYIYKVDAFVSGEEHDE